MRDMAMYSFLSLALTAIPFHLGPFGGAAEQGRVAAGFQKGGGFFHAGLEAETFVGGGTSPHPGVPRRALPFDRRDRVEDIGEGQAVGQRLDFGVGAMTKPDPVRSARPPS
jgi:hypothetical protein